MQERNRTYQKPPKAGDGTLHESDARPEANWYGGANEPQEEFINNGVDEKGSAPEENRRLNFDAGAPNRPDVDEREIERDAPAPPEVFPYGGNPGEQSDG